MILPATLLFLRAIAHMRIKYGLLYICCILINSGLLADTTTLSIDEIVIRENRIQLPFNDISRHIEILDKQSIQALQASSINELLQMVGGVDIRQRGIHGVQGDISIRGGTFEQSLVLINGVKMIDPQTGHHMMNLPMDVNDIERVEVLKGPAARVYGQNAFAGAINIVTRASDSAGVTANVEYGENSLFSGYVKGSLPVGSFRQSISYGFNTSDGYRDNTDYSIHNVFYQGQLQASSGLLDVFGGYVSRKFGANGFYGNETFTNQYEEVETALINVGYTVDAGKWKIAPRMNWRRNEDNWQFLREDPEFFQNFHTSHVFSTEVHTSYTSDHSIFGFGVEYNKIDMNSSNLGDHKRNQFGIHLENRFLLNDEKMDITPGIYLLHVSDFGTQIFPGLDFGYRLSNFVKLFANTGLTSRIPSFTDLYYEDRGNVGNPDLQEEYAFSAELGLKISRQNALIQASLFTRQASDLIDWFRSSPDDRWMPENFSSASYNGIDLSSTFVLNQDGAGQILRQVRVNYLYLDATFEENDFTFSRNELENLQHQLIIQPSFQFGENLAFRVLMKYNDRVSLDDYTVFDANLIYTQNNFEVYLKGNNIFNAEYRETNLVPMPGRWVLAGVRTRF